MRLGIVLLKHEELARDPEYSKKHLQVDVFPSVTCVVDTVVALCCFALFTV